jgi:hypothetical protein
MAKFLIGSQYFFSCYPDFSSKDIDRLEIITTDEFQYMRQITGKGKCLFQLNKNRTKEEIIKWHINSDVGMTIGKFLVPEVCAELGFTMSDLLRLRPLLKKLDGKHKYEEIIYDSYIQNGSFTLTEA